MAPKRGQPRAQPGQDAIGDPECHVLFQASTAAVDGTHRLAAASYKVFVDQIAASEGAEARRQSLAGETPGLRAGEQMPAGLRVWDDSRRSSSTKDPNKLGAGWIAENLVKAPGKANLEARWFNIRTWGSWRLAFLLARLQRQVWEAQNSGSAQSVASPDAPGSAAPQAEGATLENKAEAAPSSASVAAQDAKANVTTRAAASKAREIKTDVKISQEGAQQAEGSSSSVANPATAQGVEDTNASSSAAATADAVAPSPSASAALAAALVAPTAASSSSSSSSSSTAALGVERAGTSAQPLSSKRRAVAVEVSRQAALKPRLDSDACKTEDVPLDAPPKAKSSSSLPSQKRQRLESSKGSSSSASGSSGMISGGGSAGTTTKAGQQMDSTGNTETKTPLREKVVAPVEELLGAAAVPASVKKADKRTLSTVDARDAGGVPARSDSVESVASEAVAQKHAERAKASAATAKVPDFLKGVLDESGAVCNDKMPALVQLMAPLQEARARTQVLIAVRKTISQPMLLQQFVELGGVGRLATWLETALIRPDVYEKLFAEAFRLFKLLPMQSLPKVSKVRLLAAVKQVRERFKQVLKAQETLASQKAAPADASTKNVAESELPRSTSDSSDPSGTEGGLGAPTPGNAVDDAWARMAAEMRMVPHNAAESSSASPASSAPASAAVGAAQQAKVTKAAERANATRIKEEIARAVERIRTRPPPQTSDEWGRQLKQRSAGRGAEPAPRESDSVFAEIDRADATARAERAAQVEAERARRAKEAEEAKQTAAMRAAAAAEIEVTRQFRVVSAAREAAAAEAARKEMGASDPAESQATSRDQDDDGVSVEVVSHQPADGEHVLPAATPSQSSTEPPAKIPGDGGVRPSAISLMRVKSELGAEALPSRAGALRTKVESASAEVGATSATQNANVPFSAMKMLRAAKVEAPFADVGVANAVEMASPVRPLRAAKVEATTAAVGVTNDAASARNVLHIAKDEIATAHTATNVAEHANAAPSAWSPLRATKVEATIPDDREGTRDPFTSPRALRATKVEAAWNSSEDANAGRGVVTVGQGATASPAEDQAMKGGGILVQLFPTTSALQPMEKLLTPWDSTLAFGKDAANEIVMEHGLVSRHHCVLCYEVETGETFVEDTSTNGTFVGSVRVHRQRQRICHGDRLLLMHPELGKGDEPELGYIVGLHPATEELIHAVTASAAPELSPMELRLERPDNNLPQHEDSSAFVPNPGLANASASGSASSVDAAPVAAAAPKRRLPLPRFILPPQHINPGASGAVKLEASGTVKSETESQFQQYSSLIAPCIDDSSVNASAAIGGTTTAAPWRALPVDVASAPIEMPTASNLQALLVDAASVPIGMPTAANFQALPVDVASVPIGMPTATPLSALPVDVTSAPTVIPIAAPLPPAPVDTVSAPPLASVTPPLAGSALSFQLAQTMLSHFADAASFAPTHPPPPANPAGVGTNAWPTPPFGAVQCDAATHMSGALLANGDSVGATPSAAAPSPILTEMPLAALATASLPLLQTKLEEAPIADATRVANSVGLDGMCGVVGTGTGEDGEDTDATEESDVETGENESRPEVVIDPLARSGAEGSLSDVLDDLAAWTSVLLGEDIELIDDISDIGVGHEPMGN